MTGWTVVADVGLVALVEGDLVGFAVNLDLVDVGLVAGGVVDLIIFN